MMRDLEYQGRVLKIFEEYLTELSAAKKNADIAQTLAKEHPEVTLDIPDYTLKTWEALRGSGKLPPSRAGVPFSPRFDGLKRPVPNAVFKVPTGGGKTFLAVSALSRIMGRYLGRNTGFVLWIVPNEAIYSQTRKHLIDRQHPYRQVLDQAAAGRVRILEKEDRLDARDVNANLCVMLLMLQSANRQTKATLKMFQDRGDVHGFFPDEGDQEAHRKTLQATPNLDAYGKPGEVDAFWPMIKDSLGNALRKIRPVVVMDEGHRAISELAFSTLYGFNPCFVLELTATPKDVAAGRNKPARPANVLVEVLGTELDREGMIKMPVNLETHQSTDWRTTLAAALACLNTLDAEAKRHYAEEASYIRPILLVQVERTGSDQRDGRHIHALDAKEWLVGAGLDEAEVAIKTADTNDLNNPENQDLLAPTNRVRVIITKQALQEGWDCPFAYILCSLAASLNLSGMTQLVGRILRQPHAKKTGRILLDECYVVAHHAETAEIVRAVKEGLEEDGLGDLVKEIRASDVAAGSRGPRRIPRRLKFAKTEIYLPLVLKTERNRTRALDYETDILSGIDWSGLDVGLLAEKIPENVRPAEGQLQKIRLAENGEDRFISEEAGKYEEVLRFDRPYIVRMVSDLVPNPWVAREIVGNLTDALLTKGFNEEKLGRIVGLILSELRLWLDHTRTVLAEDLFRAEVAAGHIQFRLRADGQNWRMPDEAETFEPDTARQLVGNTGGPLVRSLFSPIYEDDFSSHDERDIAVFLDGEEALRWWHRNVARSQYSLQGWRKEKIYPDFIFAIDQNDRTARIVVLETKGEHLSGNPDTEYKRAVLQLMSQNFSCENFLPAGSFELVHHNGDTVECDMILMNEWRSKLPSLLCRLPPR